METMEYNDSKKAVNNFYMSYREEHVESTFSGLQQDIIHSLGSKKRQIWSTPYISFDALRKAK